MKRIELTQDYFAIIDDEDFELINQSKWCFDSSNGYAKTWRGEKIYMHRLIMNAPKGLQVDHINHNKLDNRKKNLRIVNQSQNNMNKINTNNKYGYKGVSFYDSRKYYQKRTTLTTNPKQWIARIKVNGKYIRLGAFNTKEEAAQAYNQAAKQHFGEFAYLNQL